MDRNIMSNPSFEENEDDVNNHVTELHFFGAHKAITQVQDVLNDRIDHLAGVRLAVGRGDKVSIGSPLATLENSSDPDALERAAAELLKAFTVSPTPPEAKPLVIERIG